MAATATLLSRLAAFQPCEVNKLKAAPVRDAATARDVAAQYSMKRVDLHLFFSERASHDIFVPFNCLSINEV